LQDWYNRRLYGVGTVEWLLATPDKHGYLMRRVSRKVGLLYSNVLADEDSIHHQRGYTDQCQEGMVWPQLAPMSSIGPCQTATL
jgi:hypothetical protein